jgi:hypothetical protein
MSTTTIQFTQEQVRTLTGITHGDLRHWRHHVPYLAAKAGKSARFTFTDLVGLAAIGEVVTVFGVQISAVAKQVDQLFSLFSETKASGLQRVVAVIEADGARLLSWPDDLDQLGRGPILLVRCDALIKRLAQQMLPTGAPIEQPLLPFPPRAIRGGA